MADVGVKVSLCPVCNVRELRKLVRNGEPGKTCGSKACRKKIMSDTAKKAGTTWNRPFGKQAESKIPFIPASIVTGRMYR